MGSLKVAIVGKQVWAMALKSDNLWVKWIHDRYIRDQNWSNFFTPQTASWDVKHICGAKKVIMEKCGSDWFTKQRYCNADVYNKLVDPSMKQRWCKDIWNNNNIPKHFFIGWLAMLNRLQIRDRLNKMGIGTSNLCLLCLCENGTKDNVHLFFRCHYNELCIQQIKSWLGIYLVTVSFPQLVGWVKRRAASNKFSRQMYISAIIAIVYMVWKERNNACWNHQVHIVDTIVKEIKSIVIHRIK